jgi:alpha-beta hydrolase superfamily lysophospholipase
MRIIISFIFGVFALSSFGQLTIEEIAEQFSKHQYGKIYRCFDDNMKANLSKNQLKELWEQLERTSGTFVSLEDIVVEDLGELTRQTGVIKLEESALKFMVSESQEGRISGLFLSVLGYAIPSYGKELKTGKKFIIFKTHGMELNGELLVPVMCNNCPVVIMVHGSGPNDKDETIGPNKVFKDIALGLASKGIASFRYDKRFNVYPELLTEQFDLYDETINDAISAYYAVKGDTSVHFGKYVMLGHSLGAYAMPLIADSLSELNGAILMSANARKLEDLVEYQMHYLTNWDGEINDEEKKIVEENVLKAERIRSNNFSDTTSAKELLVYWPGKFWKGIATYDPVATLSQNKETPFLIMQGEKDYQITMLDFKIWMKAVGEQANVRMISLPGLTHLFTPTESEKPGPSDYFLPNNVSPTAIYEIADWVNKVIP